MGEGKLLFIRTDTIQEVADALNGDSNDAEREALVEIARELGLDENDEGRWQ